MNTNNREYFNYATRHLETLNTIIDQMDTINRNMFSLYDTFAAHVL